MLVLQCSVCHHITGLKPPDGITEAATPRYQGECGEPCGTVARCQCLFKGVVPNIGGEGGISNNKPPALLFHRSFLPLLLIIISSSCHIMQPLY